VTKVRDKREREELSLNKDENMQREGMRGEMKGPREKV
jgi:hypothetical protein